MKFQSNSIFNGTITANSVADAGTNTDKFLVLNSSGVVTYRTAAELYADLGVGSSSAAYTAVLKHPVKAGEAINKGQAVYVSSADGTNMIVAKASNAAEATSSKTIGLLETTLANNGIGNVITEGLLAGLDTTGATNAGDPVWLGTGGNLIYGLINKPYAPAHLVFIGIVTRINANNGEIFVKVQNGFELKEIHDVDLITTTPVNGHILGYNGTLWVNKTIAGWLGFTPVTNARTLTINGTAYDLSADRSWTISSMIYPGAGIAVSTGTAWGTSITDNSTNWNTAYTNRITSLTVTGSSGAATLVSNVLNIPTYTLAGLGGVATSRTLTINGTAYDLSADRSWTIDSTSASTRTIQKFTATSGQTTFTITGGYAVGMVDVYMNGVKLDNATDFTASNGTTVVLAAGALTNSVIEVYKFGSQFIPNNALRVVTSFTATAAQTTFTVNYSVGLVDVYYNGSCLAQSEYTATNGTSIILATACQVNDIVVVYAYSYSVGAYSGIGGSGTATQVAYFTSSAAISSSSNLYWDNTNTRLGIGNSSPSYTLDVSGTLRNTTSAYFATASGNVGIGTTTANAKLDVNSTYASDTTTQQMFRDNTGGGLLFGGTGGAAKWLQAQDYTGAATYYNLLLNPRGGNVGIGTSSPSALLQISIPSSQSNGEALRLVSKDSIGDVYQTWFRSDNTTRKGYFGYGYGSQDNLELNQEENAPILIYTNATERMRITSGGNVGIGESNPASARLYVTSNGSALDNVYIVNTNTSAGTNNSMVFNRGASTVGIIQTTLSSTIYNTSSDYRLKQDFKNYNGLDLVLSIKTYDYEWKIDKTRMYGVVAHELSEVIPYAVSGEKDAVNKDGSLNTQGVDYSKLVPILVKAIQEMNTKIIQLEKLVATK